jgi:hypothetical protein
LIAERYGQDRLIALYSYFQEHGGDIDTALSRTLGLSTAQFTAAWLAYLDRLRAAAG